MSDTPDLSKIVSLIMQNPALIEQISALARQDKSEEEITEKAESFSAASEVTPQIKEAAKETSVRPMMRSHRHELLNAMKPYLSENRRTAIDSMASILDVIDVMIKK